MRDEKKIYSHEEVVECEQDYVSIRRRKWYSDSKLSNDTIDQTWGLAFSGGGIRSATFCLGVMQALASKTDAHPHGTLGRFDYLSTVSGGGYIGSALTTLLSVTSSTDQQQSKVDCSCLHGEFPFTTLNADSQDNDKDLSVKHQMHHLRRSGNYLAEEKRFTSRYFQRLIGTAAGGTMYNIVVCTMLYALVVLATHGVLFVMLAGNGAEASSPEAAFAKVGYSTVASNIPSTDVMKFINVIADSAHNAIVYKGPWRHSDVESSSYSTFLLTPPFRNAIIMGLIIGLGFSVAGTFLFRNTSTNTSIPEPSNTHQAEPVVIAGESKRSLKEKRLLQLFNVFLVVAMAWSVYHNVRAEKLLGVLNDLSQHGNYVLWLPMGVMLGTLVSTMVCSLVFESSLKADSADRVARSYLSTIRGSALSIFLVCLTTPVLIVVLFAFSAAPLGPFFLSVLTAILGVWGTRKINPADGVLTSVGKFLKKHPKLTIGLAALVTVLIPFSTMSKLILDIYHATGYEHLSYLWFVGLSIGGLTIAVVVVTLVINSNNISPFKFYRDRLSEAYLKTAKVFGTKDGRSVTLRDDENMPLNRLGDIHGTTDHKAPYHLITACLNLATLKSLLRADTKSTHFLFSKEFMGSPETGYMVTPSNVTVAEAVAISGAAASSIAGYHSSFGQRFFATLFNIRLGQWIANPVFVEKLSQKKAVGPIWALYLIREILGRTSLKTNLINVSDGGHTGDNLGLLPLLKRRLDVVVVVDAECDPEYIFGSLNNAIRLANIEDNTNVEIDLTGIKPSPDKYGVPMSAESVAVGKIHYASSFGVPAKEGVLVYCKSSVSTNVTSGKIPAHVENYNRTCAEFPHQSTGDQFFDPEQFEAYRALGAHVGALAAVHL